ncbi:protein kinase family protein [Paenibacillus spiritus]|uniref:Protein kinase family protein n=1 Tax=Paenibacillus spiritus TaxID=2496557 RepID=A0A5J5FQW1_9BACL|nr:MULTISPECIES: protein kinase family protein [Paenibacillus]KAA8995421.1 protein kinase family protein [Paenibacillus spiritus]
MLNRLRRFAAAWRDYRHPAGSLIGGRFRTERVLGIGSYGIVLYCRDEKEGGAVAVKVAKPTKADAGRRLLAREREVLSGLDHPFIPAIRAYGENRRGSWLALDYIAGRTLEDLIFAEGRRFGERECLEWALELLERVSHVHDRGFVHLDLRIPNVLLEANGLYLIDFGLARPIGGGSGPLWEEYDTEALGMPRSLRPPGIQSDLCDIGHMMLFMLYSAYEPEHGAPERVWEEELDLSSSLHAVLHRLLGSGKPYAGTADCIAELTGILADCRTPGP